MPKRKVRSLPSVGAEYQKKYKGKMYKMTVVKHEPVKNGIAYVVNDTLFLSPSGAAKSIVNVEVNGWDFWKIV
jgi:hypothetical protein